MTAKNRLITPEGTKDYLFEEVKRRRVVVATLSELLTRQGFAEVQTPSLEFLDVFDVEGRGIPVENMYKLTDNKGRLMVMRPDSTMPIARLMATRLKGTKLPLRLFYNQPVYSSMHKNGTLCEEVMQMGIELIGNTSVKSDLEVITTAMSMFTQSNFRMEIGHIGIFNSLIDALKLDDNQKEEIRQLIEAKNYPALNDLLDSFGSSYEVGVLKELPRLFGDERVFIKAYELINDKKTVESLDYLKELYQSLQKLCNKGTVTVDLGLVNRTDYYTGVIFKAYIEGCGEEVLSGGRYDSLLSKFDSKNNLGAIGFAINIDAISKNILLDNEKSNENKGILVFSEGGYEIEGINHLHKLIAQKVSCEYCLCETLEQAKEFAKQNKYMQIDVVSNDIKSVINI